MHCPTARLLNQQYTEATMAFLSAEANLRTGAGPFNDRLARREAADKDCRRIRLAISTHKLKCSVCANEP